MNIVQRLRYRIGPDESTEEVATRLAVGCSQGMAIAVGDDYYRVIHTRPVMVRKTTEDALNGTPVALVEDPSQPLPQKPVRVVEAQLAPEPVVVEPQLATPETPETSEPVVVEPQLPKQALPAVGQQWQTRDSRRKAIPFTITAVEGDYALTDDKRRIQLSRFNRYRLVSVS